jgi:hypothetical protein
VKGSEDIGTINQPSLEASIKEVNFMFRSYVGYFHISYCHEWSKRFNRIKWQWETRRNIHRHSECLSEFIGETVSVMPAICPVTDSKYNTGVWAQMQLHREFKPTLHELWVEDYTVKKHYSSKTNLISSSSFSNMKFYIVSFSSKLAFFCIVGSCSSEALTLF